MFMSYGVILEIQALPYLIRNIGMKTSTIVWTLAVLIVLVGVGSYAYTTQTPTTADTTPTSQATVNTNPGGVEYQPGDMTPTPETPIDKSNASTSVTASTTVHFSQ